jgi:hypothetical protein
VGSGWPPLRRVGTQPLAVCKCSSRRDAVSFCGISTAHDEGRRWTPGTARIEAEPVHATETPESMLSIYG